MAIRVEPLARMHDRGGFNCGVKELNDFLQKFALQNQKNHISKTFVAVDDAACQSDILGFYTLAIGDMDHDLLPDDVRHPKYPVSIARVARLAVQQHKQGCGLGAFLLHDALQKIKSAAQMIGIFAVVVDAKDDDASSFYQYYGFSPLEHSELTLFLPMKVIESIEV